MGARTIGLKVTFSPNNVTPLTHTSGDDSEVTFTRTDRTFAGNPHVASKVIFFFDIVVVAVDCLLCDGEWLGDRLLHGLDDFDHHDAAVLKRVVLRPAHCGHIVVEVFCAFWEVGKVVVWQGDKELLHSSLALAM